jgi:hypothetical protein
VSCDADGCACDSDNCDEVATASLLAGMFVFFLRFLFDHAGCCEGALFAAVFRRGVSCGDVKTDDANMLRRDVVCVCGALATFATDGCVGVLANF